MKRIFAAVIIVLMLTCTFGCSFISNYVDVYTEHEITAEAATGVWNLNCIYKNTHPIEFKDERITINSDGSGVYTTLTTDENGVTTENSVAMMAEFGSNSDGEGTVKLTKEGVTTEYTFSVDVPAQLLHLYITDAEDSLYHYIYVNDLAEY